MHIFNYDFLQDIYETYKTDYSPENALSKMKEVWSEIQI